MSRRYILAPNDNVTNVTLHQLRGAVRMSRAEVARRLGWSLRKVIRFERTYRADPYNVGITALKHYVAALGGHLETTIKIGRETINVDF